MTSFVCISTRKGAALTIIIGYNLHPYHQPCLLERFGNGGGFDKTDIYCSISNCNCRILYVWIDWSSEIALPALNVFWKPEFIETSTEIPTPLLSYPVPMKLYVPTPEHVLKVPASVLLMYILKYCPTRTNTIWLHPAAYYPYSWKTIFPLSGEVTEAGLRNGKWEISSMTLKWVWPDAGLKPTIRIRNTVRRRNFVKIIMQFPG